MAQDSTRFHAWQCKCCPDGILGQNGLLQESGVSCSTTFPAKHVVPFFNLPRAYEISTFHKREPPPKEILEDVSAKGGDLLNRTLENYTVRAIRETDGLGNGSQEGASDDEHKTPNASEKMDLDDPGSTGGRVTRGMPISSRNGQMPLAGGDDLSTLRPNFDGFTAAEGSETLPEMVARLLKTPDGQFLVFTIMFCLDTNFLLISPSRLTTSTTPTSPFRHTTRRQ